MPSQPATLSATLVHRFSRELNPVRNRTGSRPDRRSMRFYQTLLQSDRIRLGARHQLLFPSRGGKTMWFGNDFGW